MAEEADIITDKDPEKPTVEKPEKTFTQAELDKVLADRLARERSKMPAPEKLKAFEEWQKSQQTEAEKAAEREKALAETSAKVTALERENAIIKAGVKAEDAEYVIFQGWEDGRRIRRQSKNIPGREQEIYRARNNNC